MEKLQEIPPGSDDLPFERRQLVYQRIGWLIILLFLLAATLGVFGSGWYSSRTVVGRTFEIHYERVLRQDTGSGLKIRFLQKIEGDTVQVSANAGYLSKVAIEAILPAPLKSQATDTGALWTFSVAPETRRGEFHLTIRPEKPGAADLELRVGSESIWLKQIILP